MVTAKKYQVNERNGARKIKQRTKQKKIICKIIILKSSRAICMQRKKLQAKEQTQKAKRRERESKQASEMEEEKNQLLDVISTPFRSSISSAFFLLSQHQFLYFSALDFSTRRIICVSDLFSHPSFTFDILYVRIACTHMYAICIFVPSDIAVVCVVKLDS